MPQPPDDTVFNLTGVWDGQYGYPVVTRAPVPFTASLVEAEGRVGGSITERVEGGRTLYATVGGQRCGSDVQFLKTYEANSGAYTTVLYQGLLSEDGLEIDGQWRAMGWSGRFLMIRARGAVQRQARRVAESV